MEGTSTKTRADGTALFAGDAWFGSAANAAHFMAAKGGGMQERRGATLPRYARMTRQVKALVAGACLAGTNTRRVERALAALFGSAVVKAVVSRTWREVKTDWDAWNGRDLAGEDVARLIPDGTVMRVGLERSLAALRPDVPAWRRSPYTQHSPGPCTRRAARDGISRPACLRWIFARRSLTLSAGMDAHVAKRRGLGKAKAALARKRGSTPQLLPIPHPEPASAYALVEEAAFGGHQHQQADLARRNAIRIKPARRMPSKENAMSC